LGEHVRRDLDSKQFIAPVSPQFGKKAFANNFKIKMMIKINMLNASY
jgi:hypothetical protein